MSEPNSIVVNNRAIPFEVTRLDIHDVIYYAENPRINYLVSTHEGTVTQAVIEKKLQALDATKDLIKDIEDNGGLLEEIVVLGSEVVEGNTRLAAFRRLNDKHPEDPRWKLIPSKVLQGEVSEQELFLILGTFHVKGKTEWSAYEKAAYIHRMVNGLNCTPQKVAQQLRLHTGTVEAILQAYQTMTTSFLPAATANSDDYETQDALRKYSYFEAFYRQKDLAKRAADTPEFVNEFCTWVRRGVFPTGASVRADLPKVLKVKQARKVFLNCVDADPECALEEAKAVLDEAKPEVAEPFYRKVKEFQNLVRDTAPVEVREEIEQGGSRGSARKTVLLQCLRTLRRFCKDVGIVEEQQSK